jgi:hypothetical protein
MRRFPDSSRIIIALSSDSESSSFTDLNKGPIFDYYSDDLGPMFDSYFDDLGRGPVHEESNTDNDLGGVLLDAHNQDLESTLFEQAHKHHGLQDHRHQHMRWGAHPHLQGVPPWLLKHWRSG